MQEESRNTQPDSAPPHRDGHLLVWTCFLAIVACAGVAAAVPAIFDGRSAPTTTQRPDEARAAVIPASGGDPGVPKASVVFRNSDVPETSQPPSF